MPVAIRFDKVSFFRIRCSTSPPKKSVWSVIVNLTVRFQSFSLLIESFHNIIMCIQSEIYHKKKVLLSTKKIFRIRNTVLDPDPQLFRLSWIRIRTPCNWQKIALFSLILIPNFSKCVFCLCLCGFKTNKNCFK
jgi:hypothetical protein